MKIIERKGYESPVIQDWSIENVSVICASENYGVTATDIVVGSDIEF